MAMDAPIIVERKLPESRLLELGVRSWPKWGCSPGKFSLKFDAQETCYFLKGKVKAYVNGSQDQYVEFGAGDLVIIPQGGGLLLGCIWGGTLCNDASCCACYMCMHHPGCLPGITDFSPMLLSLDCNGLYWFVS
ncbi:hypothetical protein Cni_G07678 [Canna indica]|uniref:(S)-ureidoglycine aminohydrolase cupin domain-containing protein n=1 Tax=Canna indica TaxID=4628 RepID=A0AAQ3K2J7_9LILI|nr:hypothetical protein Cni_G07678 [Canna indica]